MREIKFRQFDPTLDGFMFFELNNGCVHITNDDIESFDDDRKNSPIEQYTGLKDRNGVEVYEGDVVKYLTHTAHVFWSPQDFGFVHYNEVIGGYAGLSFFKGYKDFEVVGNIHQHPELLEGDK